MTVHNTDEGAAVRRLGSDTARQRRAEPTALRAATPEDAAELTELAVASKRHWGYDEELIDSWRPELEFTAESIRDQIVIVATEPARIVGVVALDDIGDSRELDHLWVHPDCIGEGIGTALFRAAVREASAGGSSKILITSDPHAESFYLRMGATRIGSHPSTTPGRSLPRLSITLADA